MQAIHGWNLATGYFVDANYYRALQERCGFGEGECLVITFLPVSPLDLKAEFYVVDVSDPSTYEGAGRLLQGAVPYAELDALQPVEASEQHLAKWLVDEAKKAK